VYEHDKPFEGFLVVDLSSKEEDVTPHVMSRSSESSLVISTVAF
jgi:hypothetical protein